MNQIEALLKGDRLALARTLTLLENNSSEGQQVLDTLFKYAGNAHIIGITGSTGSGKSTLVNQLAKSFRDSHMDNPPSRVAILAVDPTSPFTGGAVLGDRVRMRELSGDEGIFIRSVATRGSQGGLARTASDMVTAMDAAGFDIIIVETVGAGQSEIEITRLANTVLLVENPGMGDDIQAIKAGILEIAHLIVINKADRPGVEQTEQALRGMLALNEGVHAYPVNLHHRTESMEQGKENKSTLSSKSWKIPLIRTIATRGEGIPAVEQALREHHAYLTETGLMTRNQNIRIKHDFEDQVRENLFSKWIETQDALSYEEKLTSLYRREVSPGALSREISNSVSFNKTAVIHLK